jgi:phosphohistidine phosphatase
MKLFIVRHGEAEAVSSSGERGLTSNGLEQAQRVGQLLSSESPELLLYSPKLRARQTAQQILAQCEGVDSIEDARLLPSATAYDVAAALETGESMGLKAVVIVSHLPLVAELVGWFVHGDPANSSPLPGFMPAAIAALDVEYIGPQEARLDWYAFAPDYVKKQR